MLSVLPATPFSTPFLLIIDSLRSVACFGAALVVGQMVGIIAQRKTRWYQRGYAIGHICFSFATFFNEIARLGHHLNWRLPISLIGVTAVLVAIHQGQRKGAIF